jgi:septation ring formation regulator EzrA
MENNSVITNKLNSLEKKIFNIENSVESKFVNLNTQNRTINKALSDRYDIIENKIKMMEEALKILQTQYEENCKKINDLEPKIGQKRWWWQMN